MSKDPVTLIQTQILRPSTAPANQTQCHKLPCEQSLNRPPDILREGSWKAVTNGSSALASKLN